MAFPTKGINSRQWAGSSCSLQEIVAGRRIHSAHSFTALVCALHLARVTALGAIANADGDEIDLVAVQHEVDGIPGMLEQVLEGGCCFKHDRPGRALRHGPWGRHAGGALRPRISAVGGWASVNPTSL